MAKRDSEFGGRGGPLPPVEFVTDEDLSAYEKALLERRTEGPQVVGLVTEAQVRAEMEKRAKKNDVVGK